MWMRGSTDTLLSTHPDAMSLVGGGYLFRPVKLHKIRFEMCVGFPPISWDVLDVCVHVCVCSPFHLQLTCE